tara:strand:+ start:365 stop:619 length:255 start_codon:yes stop_codon:yes gene_type:complete
MTDNMRVLLVGTALTVTITVLGSWGGWVTSTLMVVDKRTEVMSGKLDDTHTMLALIIEKMTPQKASAPYVQEPRIPEIRASLNE